ncbi:MAG: hypothetical protein ABJC26_15320 [Gemmatimonadaceae bacterium]
MKGQPLVLVGGSMATSLMCVVLLATTNCTEPQRLTQPPPVPASVPSKLVAVSPDTITAVVGTPVSDPPAVRVTDQNGSPVAGVKVTFAAAPGSGTLAASEVVTDGAGLARSGGWILGQSAGRHAITAQSTALPGNSVTFTSIGIARGLQIINRSAGDGQIAIAGAPVGFPFAVFASDTFGNPIVGVPISFAVVSGGGTIDRMPVTTNADGVATSSLMKSGALVGDQQVEASTAGLRTTFTVSARQAFGTRFAFVREGDIYSALADGSNPLRLTRGREPAWSADGRIAFTGTGGVYVMNEDGSNIRLVAPGGSMPAWSPDAQRLAVVKFFNGAQTIVVVTVDATVASPVRVGFDQGYHEWPTWSPDGSRIAFAADWTAFDYALELFAVDRDGTRTNQLTDGFFGSAATWPSFIMYTQPAWSPDGTKMALMQCPAWQSKNCALSYLVVMNADGSGTVKLSATKGYARPNWSPNGKWITFDGPSGIQFISANGLEQGLLIPNAQSAAWRP